MKHSGLLILLVVMLLSHAGRAQVIESVVGGKKRTVTYGIVHYAGSIGFLSAGIGLMNIRQTRSIEFLVGYLPKSILNKTFSLYYEVGTNELKLISYALNTNSLSALDMMHLGIGIRFKM